MVFALEVETGSYEDSHKSSSHKTKDWSDFDEAWIVTKKPRGHTIEEYEEALKADPDNAGMHNGLGVLFYKKKA